MSLPGSSGSNTGKTPEEQLQTELSTIRRLAESAQNRLQTPNANLAFNLRVFNGITARIRDETYPRLESLLSEVERLKRDAETDRAATEADRAAAEAERAAAELERAAAKADRAAAKADRAAAELERAAAKADRTAASELLKEHLSLATALGEIPSPKEADDPLLAAQALVTEDAKRDRDNAISEHAQTYQRLANNEAELAVSREIADRLQEELAKSQDEVEELRNKLRDQDVSIVGSRRTAAEAGLSSPERALSKRPSIDTMVAGVPLPAKSSRMPKSASAGDLGTGPTRPPSKRKSSGRTSINVPAPAQVAEEPQEPAVAAPTSTKPQKPRYEWNESFNMLRLPEDWDNDKRALFEKQYSVIKGIAPAAQVDLLSKNSMNFCLIASIEKQKAKLGPNIPIPNKAKCPTCGTKKFAGKICVYLEDISDPDEDTKRFQVIERPSN